MNTPEEKQVLKIPAIRVQTQKKSEGSKPQVRVAAYCRVSTEQESQAGSYTRQVTYYREKIERREDWTLAGIYADEGVSGTGKKKRDGFLTLLQDCEEGKVDLILTKTISRFARNTVDLLTAIRDLKNRNIAVYFEKEHINTLDSTGEILITILSSQAQEESRNISENVRWSIRQKFEKGEVMINHNHFMGYDKDADGRLEVIPAEAEAIREMFRLYLSDYSCLFIARWLEQHGIKTVMKKAKWSPEVICKMLSNEKYMGDALLQKTYTVDFLTKQRVKNTGELPKFFVKQNHPPIVSKEVFYRTQMEKLRRGYFKQQEAGKPSRYPIMSKLICTNCGNYFNRVTRKKEEKRNIVWRCKNRLEHGNRCCDRQYTVPEQNLHNAIWEAFNCITHMKQSASAATLQEMWDITEQLKECKKEILEAVQQQIQGFREWENLAAYYAKCRKEHDRLADELLGLMLVCGESAFIPCAFIPVEIYSNYQKYEDEMVSLYVERMWVISESEIVVLFQNGSMVRQKCYY